MHACSWLSQLATDARSCVKNEEDREEGRKEARRKKEIWFLRPNQPVFWEGRKELVFKAHAVNPCFGNEGWTLVFNTQATLVLRRKGRRKETDF